MKALVLVCNIVSLAFTLLVIAGDGLSTKPFDIVITVLVLAVPIFTIAVLARSGGLDRAGVATRRAAGVSNVVLLAFVCWAASQHSNEPGFVPYAVLMIVTPLLSAVALFGFRPQRPATA